MKTLILLFFVAFVNHSFCQNDVLPRISNDTLYTAEGYKITIGQQIKLGAGTRDNGDFKYITVSRGSWFTPPNARQPSLRKSDGHKTVVVKKLKKEGSAKKGYYYIVILSTGDIVNYECDIESAIAASEVVLPDEYKSQTKNSTQPMSVADELAKLKKLYDDSVITKEEYEAQKKKLLGENN